MLDMLRKRRDEEGGFTLIELMVVVLIIAILLAIAIPTFLGARQRAQDRAAQSNLRNAFTTEKVYYTDYQKYTNDTTALSELERSLRWVDGDPTEVGEVGVATADDDNRVCLTAKSASGKTFVLVDVASGSDAGTYYGTEAFNCETGDLNDLRSSW